jgi:hypothetical protein
VSSPHGIVEKAQLLTPAFSNHFEFEAGADGESRRRTALGSVVGSRLSMENERRHVDLQSLLNGRLKEEVRDDNLKT